MTFKLICGILIRKISKFLLLFKIKIKTGFFRLRSNTLDEVVLDNDGIPIPELDGSIPDVFMGRDDTEDDDPVIEEVVQEAGHNIQTEVDNIVDFRPTDSTIVTANDRTDYSFNPLINMGHQVIQQIWAGPGHWKLKYIRNSRLIYSGKFVCLVCF